MKEIIERDEEKNTCLVARCENCGRLHVYKRERKDGEGCLCCGGGPMRMLGNAIVHENKTSDVKVRVSVEREELDKLIKDMDRVNRLADETYDKIRKMSKINYDYKKNTYQSLKFLILTVLMAVSVGAALTKQETDNVQQRMKIIEQKIEMQEEGKEPEEDGTIHEMRVHGDADNRHNKGHKEQIKVYKERGINVNDDRARDEKRCVGMLFKT